MQSEYKVFMTAALPAGIICFLIYLKALSCGFVHWDDTDFILKNLVIRQFDSNLFAWSFTTIAPFSGIWIPATWISFAVDYHFWGLNPVGYHLTNILLHAVNVTILVLIAEHLCRRTFLIDSTPVWVANIALLLAGLIFGIHPLRVESVAWVTERKDVLNGIFTFSALLFYLQYVQKKEVGMQGAAIRNYIFSLLCFLFSLMAKPVSVVLPVMLLVVDWYPLDRLNKTCLKAVLREKVPYFLIASIVTLTTLYIASGKEGLLVSLTNFPPFERIIVSGNALFEYFRLMLMPVGIIQYDPLPPQISYSYLGKCFIVIVVVVAVFLRRSRIMIASILCFLLPLLPTLALFQNNDHAYASRYTYLPSALPSIAIAAAIVLTCRTMTVSWRGITRWILVVLTSTTIVFYAFMTVKLIGVWRDTGTFWSRIIEVQPMGRAYQERGLYYFNIKKFDLAIADFTKAIEIAFGLGMYDRYNLNAFRGEAFMKSGKYEQAVRDFTFAISVAPRPVYYYHRGLALKASGKIEASDEDFRRAGAEKGSIEWY